MHVAPREVAMFEWSRVRFTSGALHSTCSSEAERSIADFFHKLRYTHVIFPYDGLMLMVVSLAIVYTTKVANLVLLVLWRHCYKYGNLLVCRCFVDFLKGSWLHKTERVPRSVPTRCCGQNPCNVDSRRMHNSTNNNIHPNTMMALISLTRLWTATMRNSDNNNKCNAWLGRIVRFQVVKPAVSITISFVAQKNCAVLRLSAYEYVL